MSLFNKIFGTSNKIKVQFINSLTGESIGVCDMDPEQLPQSFSIATTMQIEGKEWTVEQAFPPESADFIISKQLVLKLREVEYINPENILFSLPTISNEFPPTTNRALFTNFEITIHGDEWRQKEFLNISSFPLVDIETAAIDHIWSNNSREFDNSQTGFNKCHVRETIGEPGLSLDFRQLKALLNISKAGAVKIDDQYVENGFSLKTTLTTYYGILKNKTVTHLCISSFSDDTFEEIQKITEAFNLLFINWYKCDIITAEND